MGLAIYKDQGIGDQRKHYCQDNPHHARILLFWSLYRMRSHLLHIQEDIDILLGGCWQSMLLAQHMDDLRDMD